MRYWEILVFCLGISLDVFGAAVCQGAVLGELRRRRIAAYCLIFWVQNIGLCFVPKLIGNLLASTNENNPAVIAAKKAGADFIPYDYTVPLVVFASFGVVALLFAIYLKALDKKKGFGLEEPNIK